MSAVLAFAPMERPARGAEPARLVVPSYDRNDRPQEAYFHELLDLALQKTVARDGPYHIKTDPRRMSIARSIDEVQRQGAVNIVWLAHHAERDRALSPVRVDLLGELNNYRVLMIRRGDQARFDNIGSADDLRRMTAGMGQQWAVTKIMRQRGFPIVAALTNASLFRMLEMKRFDYCPRGLYEAWHEVALPENSALAIEDKLLLYLDAPFYFYVNKHNTALAGRLERGLQAAQADGSLGLLQSRYFKRALDELRSNKRKLIVLSGQAGSVAPDAVPGAPPYK
ncbi:MAG: hypothetical protein ABIV04_23240 [Massilia sp.]